VCPNTSLVNRGTSKSTLVLQDSKSRYTINMFDMSGINRESVKNEGYVKDKRKCNLTIQRKRIDANQKIFIQKSKKVYSKVVIHY